MSRGMSRGGGGGAFPIVIAVLGTLIVIVIGIFLYVSFSGDSSTDVLNGGQATALATLNETPTPSPIPTSTPESTPDVAPTIPPADESTPDPAGATPTIQITPAPVYASATVWASSLKVRSTPDLNAAEIGKVRRETVLTVVDEKSSWLKVEYGGGYGWVWRDYCVRGGASLPTVKPEPKVDLVDSMTRDASSTSTLVVIKIHFNIGVYGDSAKGSAISQNDFTITGGAFRSATPIEGNSLDTQDITLYIEPLAEKTEIKVTVKDDSVFDGAGKADDGSSKTFDIPAAAS